MCQDIKTPASTTPLIHLARPWGQLTQSYPVGLAYDRKGHFKEVVRGGTFNLLRGVGNQYQPSPFGLNGDTKALNGKKTPTIQSSLVILINLKLFEGGN